MFVIVRRFQARRPRRHGRLHRQRLACRLAIVLRGRVPGLLELVAASRWAVGFQARIAAARAGAVHDPRHRAVSTNFWAAPADQAFVQQLMFMKNLAVTGGLLFVFRARAGPASIDMRRSAAA